MNLNAILRNASRWFSDTPERALDQAYQAALMIKAIEDEHFNGKKITAESANYGDSAFSYFESELKKYLKIVKSRLREFNMSRSMVNRVEPKRFKNNRANSAESLANFYAMELDEKSSIIIEKLNFIDETIAKYENKNSLITQSSALVEVPKPKEDFNQEVPRNLPKRVPTTSKIQQTSGTFAKDVGPKAETFASKTGVLPRSILRTVNRLQRDLNPNAEAEVVQNFRSSQTKTVISVKFILTLIIVPILTQQIAKTFVVSPIVNHFRNQEETVLFLNQDLEEEAFVELERFEQQLKFRTLLGFAPRLNQEEIEAQLQEEALELAEEYRNRSFNAIKNIFADLLATITFCLVIVNSKKEIAILKSFIDDVVYGLSDSAKAFLIILFTDMFVGFHSPHGWEVILAGLARHLGLPESKDFIFLFIATFPVILDSVIKYWIFRYLNRISPSAVATYKTMNE
ncbi:MAG: proton extrusion protein PcxA [Kastovskya adunca ATA6-11-RM4]|jgi:hypothetical protein|nr:proton extrusion protein PcxA [Kastovskya adunca ATA6-11-RM4]